MFAEKLQIVVYKGFQVLIYHKDTSCYNSSSSPISNTPSKVVTKLQILSILYVLQLIVIQGYVGTTIEYNTSKIHQSTRGIVLSYKENQVNIWPKRN